MPFGSDSASSHCIFENLNNDSSLKRTLAGTYFSRVRYCFELMQNEESKSAMTRVILTQKDALKKGYLAPNKIEMGIVSEEKIDTFNLPIYYTSPKELRGIIERNGCFSIEKLDTLDIPKQHITMPDLIHRALYMRAVLEALIEKHFGVEIIDQLFEIYATKLSKSPIFLNPDDQKMTALFVLLKPKENK
ncbi:SAM dependent carboxyl methyltransferase [Corchorus olitorius]|uniref:SAM dependent carboxyl methyltransferase n=1 Tax=Corchorus olitorius TaxID=93759 RepID=A0A1R3KAG8_9ROSI|nr:SAM dependent carboxyl methyltransferase [Corchorus olitorius]